MKYTCVGTPFQLVPTMTWFEREVTKQKSKNERHSANVTEESLSIAFVNCYLVVNEIFLQPPTTAQDLWYAKRPRLHVLSTPTR